MKKLTAIFLCVFTLAAMSDCRAQAAPSGNIDPKLVGIWGRGLDALGDWHNYSTGAYEFSSATVRGIEFKADGTFNSMEILSGRTGTLQVFFKGNYRVEGSAIYFTNLLHKQTSLDRNNNIKDTSHDYKSVANQILLFEFVDFNDTQLLTFKYDDHVVITDGVIYFGENTTFERIVE